MQTKKPWRTDTSPGLSKNFKYKTMITENDLDCNSLSTQDVQPGFISGNDLPLFTTTSPKKDQYIFGDLKSWNDLDLTKIKTLGLAGVLDTEFYTPTKEWQLKQIKRIGLSTQCKGIDESVPGKIFLHPTHADELNQARVNQGLEQLPIVKSDFHFVDYLNELGLEATIQDSTPDEVRKLPTLILTMSGHFFTAELLMVCGGQFKEEVKNHIRAKRIQTRRRLIIEGKDSKSPDWASFSHSTITINGVEFQIALRIIDTCAIHGIAGYGAIAEAVGYKLMFKDNFNQSEKENMLETALNRPKDFEDYSLGDLYVYEILLKYSKEWFKVHEKLKLESYFNLPKMTIGGTVKELFLSALASKLGIKTEIVEETEDGVKVKKINFKKELKERVLDKYLRFNPENLRKAIHETRALLTKVEGGRCRNNRPLDIIVKPKKVKVGDKEYWTTVLVDIDISGCYGNGQRNQDYPIGNPVIIDFRVSDNNEYPTLREVLKSFNVNVELLVKKNREDWENQKNWGELLPGMWYFRVSGKSDLIYPQDYFGSWFTPSEGYGVDVMAKFVATMGNDTENDQPDLVDFDEEYGSLKPFNNQIHNAVLTHDGLQWILAIASKRQRNELLDNLVVQSGAVYPASEKIEVEDYSTAIETLDKCYKQWKPKNKIKIGKGKGWEVDRKTAECNNWFSLNLGNLLIDNLLIERKKAKITDGNKSPLDILFKLCVNTLYGDMVSKFFITSNPVVGNNITARARALAWYMEKAFHGWQSITDGCTFDINQVVFSARDDINGEFVNTHQMNPKKLETRASFNPLGKTEGFLLDESGEIFIKEGEKLTSIGKGADNAWINQKAMEHLQNLFPCVDVLHSQSTDIKVDKNTLQVSYPERKGQYSFETKDVYHSGCFDGTANYLLNQPDESKSVMKRRGYELKKKHGGWVKDEAAEGDNEQIIESERYSNKNNPGTDFMRNLFENPSAVPRQVPAVKEGILKVGEYQEHIEKYDNLGIEPGDGVKKLLLMQEFSLTQFTFKTYEQYMGWKKIIESYKDESKQSLEAFFLNKDGTLNYELMVKTVDQMIAEGVMNPYQELDPENHLARKLKGKTTKGERKSKYEAKSHPNIHAYKQVKESLNTR